ncbi:hypothetical protein CAPTEDRAFT_225537 [Capitella teleta]|uniref:YTH domain-containing protein n=1 Tax=Capitella teleta TaxID=283909 RepID=R7T510_CAPTE|nr:hypothetical protein CAPTEDRAFT_225537 [Capitella teleta]|eukprot:ELT88031.1 hypothetical protein CAPTEDRAFT_225537 [Capitella teleta]
MEIVASVPSFLVLDDDMNVLDEILTLSSEIDPDLDDKRDKKVSLSSMKSNGKSSPSKSQISEDEKMSSGSPISSNDARIQELERERRRLEKENAERKKKLEKLKEEERASQEAVERVDKEYIREEKQSRKKADGGESEEEQVVNQSQDYDTRSEAGSSVGSLSSSSQSMNGDLADFDGVDMKNPDTRKRKHARGGGERDISPIQWDCRSNVSRESGALSESASPRANSIAKKPRTDDSYPLRDGVADSVAEQSSKLRYVFRHARFFLIKSNNHENVALAKAKGVWSTPPQNESKLNQAFRQCSNVILVFSVKESGKYQGDFFISCFARLASESDKTHPPIRWVLPPGLGQRAFNGVFKLDWINRKDLSFSNTMHLHNPWNENKPVKIGRDGQEVEPQCGEALCRLFPPDTNVDLRTIALKAKKAHRQKEREHFYASMSRATEGSSPIEESSSSRSRSRSGYDDRDRRDRRRDFGRSNCEWCALLVTCRLSRTIGNAEDQTIALPVLEFAGKRFLTGHPLAIWTHLHTTADVIILPVIAHPPDECTAAEVALTNIVDRMREMWTISCVGPLRGIGGTCIALLLLGFVFNYGKRRLHMRVFFSFCFRLFISYLTVLRTE